MPDSLERRQLLEMALRPLGALRTDEEFSQDQGGIESLIERLAEGRPSEPKHFAFEDGESLPRYDGERTTWLSPAGDGALRVRLEDPWDLASVAVVLRPDGQVGEFEEIEGFGVPDSELTQQARADRERFEQQHREQEENEPRQEEAWEERQARFRTENLIRTVAAPAGQDPDGPVVAYIALYADGVAVDFLVPRPPEEVIDPEDPDDPFAEPHFAAMFPEMEIDDGLGTEFKVADLDYVDPDSSPMRSRLSYSPAVAPAARNLRVAFGPRVVMIDLGGAE